MSSCFRNFPIVQNKLTKVFYKCQCIVNNSIEILDTGEENAEQTDQGAAVGAGVQSGGIGGAVRRIKAGGLQLGERQHSALN